MAKENAKERDRNERHLHGLLNFGSVHKVSAFQP